METNRSIRTSILPGSSLDLTDAYFHVPVCLPFRKFLRFVWKNKKSRFKVLPFGRSTAALEFTNLMQVAIDQLHSHESQINYNQDDSLIKELSPEKLYLNTDVVITLLIFLGFQISWKRSNLIRVDLLQEASITKFKYSCLLTRYKSLRSRLHWDGIFAYELPLFNICQKFFESIADHYYCSSFAQTSLVSRSSSIVLCSSTGSTGTTQSSVPVERQDSSSNSRDTTSIWVVSLMNGFKKRGFPECAVRYLSKTVRESTIIVYDARWTIFRSWCSEKEVGPFQISVNQLADFLIHLYY